MFVAFDIAAAFPSLGHDWLWAVLARTGLPQGYLTFIESRYFGPRGFASVQGSKQFLFYLQSGVMQGCPLSGSVWALAMDPILRRLVEQSADPSLGDWRGEVGGCADDTGIAQPRLQDLVRVFPVFKDAEELAMLRLQTAKTVIVPLWAELTDSAVSRTRGFLQQYIPE